MMMEGFWRRDFTVASYAQIYSMLACWQAHWVFVFGRLVDPPKSFNVCGPS
jgi:hypothetical protein